MKSNEPLSNQMPAKAFEKIHQQAIEWETEYLIGAKVFTEDQYDEAWDQAVENVAEEMGIYLL